MWQVDFQRTSLRFREMYAEAELISRDVIGACFDSDPAKRFLVECKRREIIYLVGRTVKLTGANF
jgi:hypothetical protein